MAIGCSHAARLESGLDQRAESALEIRPDRLEALISAVHMNTHSPLAS
ncbi:hypothetical protein IU474_28500 [Nocardia otitidiscaviarum]|nr:hypothetical protein [Nocardia otitidiscaviarum]MBF6240992.1 hypothetical protein [Nocardia otitidiscaviarum]